MLPNQNPLPPIDSPNEVRDSISGSANKADIVISGPVYDDLLESAKDLVDFTVNGKEPPVIIREVVVKAIALFLKSKNTEIVLRDRKNGTSETYSLWKTRS